MERRKVLTVRGSIYIDRRLYDFCPRLRFRKIFFRDSSVSSVFRCFLCFLCFLVKTMFFKETCFFFLKGLEKDTFQGQTVKWQQRNSSNQNYSLGVAYSRMCTYNRRKPCAWNTKTNREISQRKNGQELVLVACICCLYLWQLIVFVLVILLGRALCISIRN
jgi:hypothetical protein